MKIWLLQDYLRSGGTERQTLLLSHAFAQAGHAVELVTFRPGGTLAGSASNATTSANGGTVTRRCLQTFDTRLNWFAPGLVSAARAAKPDVILCMGRMANCHGGRLQAALPQTVLLGTMRTGKRLPFLYRRSLKRVTHIVANSDEAAASLVLDYDLLPSKISVIHNALVFPASASVDASSDQLRSDPDSAPNQLRARHGAGPDTCVLLCVAMLRPEKNQRALIEIAAGLPAGTDWQLWLAGEGSARPECEALARKLGVADRVKFLGFQADPTPLYRAADVAVLASRAESLSNFLIEAQAHGLPAVACETGGVAECLQEGVSGRVVSLDDHPAFRTALSVYLENGDTRQSASRAARLFARESFDPERQTARYLTLIERLRKR